MRALPAPLGAEAAEHAGAEELPEVQKPLLEQTAHDAGPRESGLAQEQLPTSSGVNAARSRRKSPQEECVGEFFQAWR